MSIALVAASVAVVVAALQNKYQPFYPHILHVYSISMVYEFDYQCTDFRPI